MTVLASEFIQLWGGELELVALSRLYKRSIVVYNEVDSTKVQEQIFLGGEDEERNCTVIDKLQNPVRNICLEM